MAHANIAAYYPAALALSEAGRCDFDPATVLPGGPAELIPGLDGGPLRTTLERFSRPTDFWRRLRRSMREAVDIHVLPCTAVTSIRLRPDGRGVDHLAVSPPSGRDCVLRARRYVLAGGGLEVARLLLASDDLRSGGIGNDGDQLGRNYMSHLCVTKGVLSLARPGMTAGFGYAQDADGVYVRRRLWITPEAQRRHRLLNTTFRTSIPEPADPRHRDAVLSAMFLSKRLVQREYAAKFGAAPEGLGSYARHLANVVSQPVALGRFAAHWTARRLLASRKLPSVVRPAVENRTTLEVHAEQSPLPESRVKLGNERDRFGMRRLCVSWRLAESDVESVQAAYELLARRLRETGLGRLEVDPDELGDVVRSAGIVGGHHIGLTRMSADPRAGVVDGDCRVHGTEDLYVASASVLPTSGQANPTLTVLALALRLAEHLDACLDAGADELGCLA